MYHPSFNAFECDSCGVLTTQAPDETLRATWFRAWDNGWRAGPGPQTHGCPSCEQPPLAARSR